MNQGLSLRKTADKLEISLNTAFRWRHRFLSAMKKKTGKEKTKTQTASAYVLPFWNKGKPWDKPIRPNVTSVFSIDISGNITAQVIGLFGTQPGKLLSADQYAYLPAKTMPRLIKHTAVKCSSIKWKTLIEQTHNRATEWLGNSAG